MKSLPCTTLIPLSLLLISFSASCPANAERDERAQTLIIGKVSDDPAKHMNKLQAIGEYVVSKLKGLGINKAKIVFARDNQEMINFINEGQVDWITESVYSALIYEHQANARICLKRWKNNEATYHTVFITRKDSGIEDLKQLQGKTLALEDNGSTTGFFLPIIELMEENLPATYLPTQQNAFPENYVGYVFARKEINIAAWVYKGLAHAGAYSNTDWESENRTPLAMKKELKVFDKTADYPRMLELLAPHVPKTLENKLVRILLEAEFSPAGVKALTKFQHTTRFERLDKPALDAIERARNLLPKIKDHSVASLPVTQF